MSATLDALLDPLAPFLDDNAVEEICCQRPGEVWIFKEGQYDRHFVPELDAEHIEDLAISAAAQRRMDVWRNMPPLDTDLRGRGRLSAIFQPIVGEGLPCITIRRGGGYWPTMGELRTGGLFKKARSKHDPSSHPHLVEVYRDAMATEDDVVREEKLEAFFNGAAEENLSILGVGMTASGKTTFIKAYIRAVRRKSERIVVVADTPEMIGLEEFFPNSVQLFYDKNSDREGMGAADLIAAALRMRPHRLIVQEVRDGDAAVALIDGLMSGHPGATTIHANSCDAAFERLKFVIKKTPAGAAYKDEDVIKQLKELIDVVVHFQSRSKDTDFAIDEIWFREAQP